MVPCLQCGAECDLPARQCHQCSYWFPLPEIARLKDQYTKAQLEVQARAAGLRHLGPRGDRSKDYLAARIATREE